MNIKNVYTIFFSPTGGTKSIACMIGDGIASQLSVVNNKIDFTLPDQRLDKHCFTEHDLAIFAMPVYAGRIPNKILPFVQSLFSGENTPVVLISVFGNRSFDEALMELKIELEKRNFKAIAAAAIVSQHVFSEQLAKNRPDQQDLQEIQQFITDITEMILRQQNKVDNSDRVYHTEQNIPEESALINQKNVIKTKSAGLDLPGHDPVGPYYVPLGADGKPVHFLKAKPDTDINLCINCKACAKSCPMGSISIDDVCSVPGICIKCQACIKICPTNAKYFSDPAFISHVKMLEKNYSDRADNEFFYK
ncbi:MAG TPA: 4Fe-4S binding protein [Clostridiaceae bacterium]|nr:4Fe-4S binding protein [Clostridiaceae bacterium]